MRSAVSRSVLGLVVLAVVTFGLAHDMDMSIAHSPQHEAEQSYGSHVDGASPHTEVLCALILIIVSLGKLAGLAEVGHRRSAGMSPSRWEGRARDADRRRSRTSLAVPCRLPMLA